MKVTYNWLKDFADIKIPANELADKLTMAGLEVTSLEEKGPDFVFEIEVTSNRPDWLSARGIAREAAAITNKKFNVQSLMFNAKNIKHSTLNIKQLSIKIEDKKDCPLYTAKIIQGVCVGYSPDTLKNRLGLLGCRSVNNIVDITNYILFDSGEPLHAFDLDKLKGSAIIVRRAKAGEKITTIDGEVRVLNPDILVIADEERPVAVAGVMGSLDTEVTYATKNILLEAAAFDPVVVRRGRRVLGIQSDSSYRFERGVNLEIVEAASCQAAQFIQEVAGGRCVLAKSLRLTKAKQKNIILDASAVNKILGINITVPKIKKILKGLGFEAKIKTKNYFTVKIPAHRPDVAQDVDLIEEIARIYGYENIPQTLPRVRPQISVGQSRDTISLIKNILASLGLNEVITYSLVDKGLLNNFGMYRDYESIEIVNPISNEQEVLRPALIPSLVSCAAYNLNQKQGYINIFEIAKVFSQSKPSPREEWRLGILLCGTRNFLLQQGLVKDPVGLLHLKGILETLFVRLGVRDYSFNSNEDISGITVYTAEEQIGLISELEQSVLDKLGIKNKDIFVLEVSLDRLLAYANLNRKFSHLPVYPGITRDISLILKEDIAVADALGVIKEEGRPLLKEASIADYYKGKQIPRGFKGLTISCFYRSDERTLTEAEINPAHSLICELLTDRFGAEIR